MKLTIPIQIFPQYPLITRLEESKCPVIITSSSIFLSNEHCSNTKISHAVLCYGIPSLDDKTIYKAATTAARRPTIPPTPTSPTECPAFAVTSPAALEVAVGPAVVTVPFPGLEVVAGAVLKEPISVVEAGPEEDDDEPGDADEVELSEVVSAVLVLSEAVVSAGAMVHLLGAFWAC